MMVIPVNPRSFDKFKADAKQRTTDPLQVLDLVAMDVVTALHIRRSSNITTTTAANAPSFNHSLLSNFNNHHLFPPIPRRKRSPPSARNHDVKISSIPGMEHDLDYQNQENVRNIGGKRKFLEREPEVKQTKKIKRLFAEDKEKIKIEQETEVQEKKKIKKPSTRPMVRSTKALNPEPLRPELEAKITALGGQNAKLVIQKYLYPTDVNPGHDRLSIPELQVQDRTFLTKDEADLLYDEGGELKVKVLEPCGFVSDMILKKWNMPSTRNLNLRTYWTKLMKRNKDEYDEKTGKLIERKFFDAGDIIQVWSFRVSREDIHQEIIDPIGHDDEPVAEEEDPGKLWLALINLSRPVPNNGDEQIVQLV
ncbi:uncharacterized protein LOC126661321 [Mercurialis annua]|uniref:uncharacterized protein LOC126661321 n=1 Tax=Mercurialis annua TaxID=3986 RepID=UPI002160BCFA|nr:uncharacterized protein LOC126661321 [Mercurialis annua]